MSALAAAGRNAAKWKLHVQSLSFACLGFALRTAYVFINFRHGPVLEALFFGLAIVPWVIGWLFVLLFWIKSHNRTLNMNAFRRGMIIYTAISLIITLGGLVAEAFIPIARYVWAITEGIYFLVFAGLFNYYANAVRRLAKEAATRQDATHREDVAQERRAVRAKVNRATTIIRVGSIALVLLVCQLALAILLRWDEQPWSWYIPHSIFRFEELFIMSCLIKLMHPVHQNRVEFLQMWRVLFCVEVITVSSATGANDKISTGKSTSLHNPDSIDNKVADAISSIVDSGMGDFDDSFIDIHVDPYDGRGGERAVECDRLGRKIVQPIFFSSSEPPTTEQTPSDAAASPVEDA
jgi:hypothetical protein